MPDRNELLSRDNGRAKAESEAEALLLLAHLYLSHARPEKAAVLLEALMDLDPAEPEAILRPLCAALLLSGRPAEALDAGEALERLLRPGPDADRLCAARLRAEALWSLGRPEDARRLLKQALRETGPPL